jgi:putative membrane protein
MSPRWVQRLRSTGAQPDPRVTFANERTFLAWIRTALALIAAGVALEALADDLGRPVLRRGIAIALIMLGILTSGWAFRRWLRTERALRTGLPLPLPLLAPVLSYGIALVALVLLAVLLVGRG